MELILKKKHLIFIVLIFVNIISCTTVTNHTDCNKKDQAIKWKYKLEQPFSMDLVDTCLLFQDNRLGKLVLLSSKTGKVRLMRSYANKEYKGVVIPFVLTDRL